MTSKISSFSPTTRTAFSWDQEFKPRTKDIQEHLIRMVGSKSEISNKEVFMLCLAVGYHYDKTRPRPPRATDAVRLSAVKEHEFAIMKSVALAKTKDYTILLHEDRMYDIIEEYAAGGLELLVTQMDSKPDFQNFLIKLLYEQAKKTATGISSDID